MADETQNAPVAGAETATQEKEKKLYVYYFSDPDAKDPLLRFHIIYSDVEFAELPWHVHTKKPDENLKSPVWSNDVNGWVEDSKDGQAEILAQAQAKIEALDKSKAELEQINRANAQQTQMITKQLGNQMTMMVQMQQTLAILAKGSQAQPAAPTVNTNINGGNN